MVIDCSGPGRRVQQRETADFCVCEEEAEEEEEEEEASESLKDFYVGHFHA